MNDREFLEAVGISLIAASLICGLLTLGFWLQKGAWPDWSLATLFKITPSTSWVGLNKVVQWLLDQSVGIWLVMLGFVFSILPTGRRAPAKPLSPEEEDALARRIRHDIGMD